MRIEKRYAVPMDRNGNSNGLSRPSHLILISENEDESEALDEFFGNHVDVDGLISKIVGEVRLSDGYAEHYIALKSNI